jgi:hypothetical protein
MREGVTIAAMRDSDTREVMDIRGQLVTIVVLRMIVVMNEGMIGRKLPPEEDMIEVMIEVMIGPTTTIGLTLTGLGAGAGRHPWLPLLALGCPTFNRMRGVALCLMCLVLRTVCGYFDVIGIEHGFDCKARSVLPDTESRKFLLRWGWSVSCSKEFTDC